MPERSFARKGNRRNEEDEGEKERMLDNEDTNRDGIEDREENMAAPKRSFNRKREKMDRERDRRSAKDIAREEDGEATRGGGRSSYDRVEGNDDEPAGAKDEPTDGTENNGDIEMTAEKKKSKWFKGKSKLFGKGKKSGGRSDNEVRENCFIFFLHYALLVNTSFVFVYLNDRRMMMKMI